MKCIKNILTAEISRVSDAIATSRVDAGTHTFVGKKAWKTEVRDANKVAPKVEEVTAEVVAEKPKKSKKKA